MTTPIVLDTDGSVLPLASEKRYNLREFEETVRFGCSMKEWRNFTSALPPIPKNACVFTGSGDFHHLTLELLSRCSDKPFDLLVFDNHPDDMRYLFGIHCGSWVSHAAKLPFVKNIKVIGISSSDVTLPHFYEIRMRPLWQKKLQFWTVGVKSEWLNFFAPKGSAKVFDCPKNLTDALISELKQSQRIYVSVDKDVFSKHVVNTDWDQGMFEFEDAEKIISSCRDKIIASDVCGDCSSYTYKSRFKRFLSGLDGQSQTDPQLMPDIRQRHRIINEKLLSLLS